MMLTLNEFQKIKEIKEDHWLLKENWKPDKFDNDFDKGPMDNPATLGLNYDWYGDLSTSHFVGSVWIGHEVIQVVPKQSGKKVVDYLRMFIDCINDPIVAGQLDRCFYFWPDKESIDAKDAHKFTIMIVALFLRELELLCRRHLRGNFQKITHNLTGKVKGRILLKDHLQNNTLHGRQDRFFCQYQVFNRDSLENRILHAALAQSKRYMARHLSLLGETDSTLRGWSSVSDAALATVPLVRIAPSDFSRVHLGGLKKAYKIPLDWAKRVLSILGSDPNSEPTQEKAKIPPFAIDMNELFERYCEVKLRNEDYGDRLWAGYHVENLGGKIPVRPDFIIRKNQTVLDAKYKYNWEKKWEDIKQRPYLKNDIYQIMAYTRHKRVAEEAGTDHQEGSYPFPKAVILYPVIDEKNNGKILPEEQFGRDDFPLLYVRKVTLPLEKTSKTIST